MGKDIIKREQGRPTKYKPEYDEKSRKLCLLGATDRQMADFFGVDERTINRWKHDFPSFCQSIKTAKIEADSDVAKSLFDSAMDGNTTAQIFWLKNRQPLYWRDKQEIITTKDWELGLAEIVRIVSEEVKDPETIQRIAGRFEASFEVREETS